MDKIFGYNIPPILAEEETQKYLKEYKEGLIKARETLIIHHINLVLCIIYKRYAEYYNKDELVMSGIIGLIKAVDNYKFSKQNKFSTFATKCIDNEIITYLRKEQKHYNNTSYEEIIESRELDIMDYSSSNIAKDYENKESINELQEIIKNLSDDYRELYEMYFVKKMPQKEIASLLNVTQGYVSKKTKKLIYKIKKEVIKNNTVE